MKKGIRRSLAMVIAIIMMIQLIPMSAFAREPEEEGVFQEQSEHIIVAAEVNIFKGKMEVKFIPPAVDTPYKLRIDLPPFYTMEDEAIPDGGVKTIQVVEEDTPYIGGATYERIEWDGSSAGGEFEGYFGPVRDSKIMGYEFRDLSAAMVKAGADADKIPLPIRVALVVDGEEAESVTLDFTSKIMNEMYQPQPYPVEDTIENVYSYYAGSSSYIDMLYSRSNNDIGADGWMASEQLHYPYTDLYSYVPYDDERKLTPVFRTNDASYIGDQEIDGVLYAVFRWSDTINYEGETMRKDGIYYQFALADMGYLSYRLPSDYKPGDTYTFSERQIKFGYTELAQPHIVDHIQLPESYTVPAYEDIAFTTGTRSTFPDAPIDQQNAYAQGFEDKIYYSILNESRTQPTRSYQDVKVELDFSSKWNGVDGQPVQAVQPLGISLDAAALEYVKYTLSNGIEQTLDLRNGQYNFDIPDGETVTKIEILYQQVDRYSDRDIAIRMHHAALEQIECQFFVGVKVTSAENETPIWDARVYYDSVMGPDVLRVYPCKAYDEKAPDQYILCDGKDGLDGCANSPDSYNQVIRFIKYGNQHMRNYENAQIKINLHPEPLSKLRGIELTQKLYQEIGTVVDRVELHYKTNLHTEERIANTIAAREAGTAFDGIDHGKHMAILLDLAEDEYVTEASVHFGTIYGEEMSGSGSYPEQNLDYGFAMLFDMSKNYPSSSTTTLGQSYNDELDNTNGADRWTVKAEFLSDSSTSTSYRTGKGYLFFGNRVNYRLRGNGMYDDPSPRAEWVSYYDANGEKVTSVSTKKTIQAQLNNLVSWGDHYYSSNPDFVDRKMWGEPSRYLPDECLDGYLYVQVNSDYELSHVIANPNGGAEYETKELELHAKIPIDVQNTQEAFDWGDYSGSGEYTPGPGNLESVLYIYRIEGLHSPVKQVSADMYVREDADIRSNSKAIMKAAVSYNDAFQTWNSPGSIASQKGMALKVRNYNKGYDEAPRELSTYWRLFEQTPAVDSDPTKNKVFHEVPLSWIDSKIPHRYITGLNISTLSAGAVDAAGGVAQTDDVNMVEIRGKDVRFITDESGKLILEVTVEAPATAQAQTDIGFQILLPRKGDQLTIDGKSYLSEYGLYLDVSRVNDQLKVKELKTTYYEGLQWSTATYPKTYYSQYLDATDGQWKKLETWPDETQIAGLQSVLRTYYPENTTVSNRVIKRVYYIPVTTQTEELEALTVSNPQAYIGLKSMVGTNSAWTDQVPVCYTYDNTYQLSVYAGYDTNENRLDDEYYSQYTKRPTMTLEAFDADGQKINAQTVYDEEEQCYTIDIPRSISVSYLKVSDMKYGLRTGLQPVGIPTYSNPAANSLQDNWTIDVTAEDIANGNLTYHALVYEMPTIDVSDVELNIQETETLSPKVSNSKYTVTYEVKDPEIATISPAGVVTGLKEGETTYTATITNNLGQNASDTAKITVTMPQVQVEGSKTWIDYDNLYGLRPDSVKLQLYHGDEAVGQAVSVSDSNGWKHTWTVPKFDENGEEIHYTVEEVGTCDGYSSKSNATGTGITNILDESVLIGEISVAKQAENADDQTFTFQLVGPGNIYYQATVKAGESTAAWTHNNTGTLVTKFPTGEYTLYELPSEGYYLDELGAAAGTVEEINGGQALKFTIAEDNAKIQVNAINKPTNGGSITVKHEISKEDLLHAADEFTFILRNKDTEEEVERVKIAANGTYTFQNLDLGTEYQVVQKLDSKYTTYLTSVLNGKNDPGEVNVEEKTYTFTPQESNLSGAVTFRNTAPSIPDQTMYKLTYESNGGTYFEPEYYPEGSKVELTNHPEKEGFNFLCWCSDKELTQEIKTVEMVENITVYAKWEEKADKTGGLIVTKTVSGDGADETENFNFRITLDDTSINGAYGDVTFASGAADFTLHHNQSVEVSGLPAGTGYKVEELQENQSEEIAEHVHDAECGYVEAIAGSPCNHEHDETCGYTRAEAGSPCTHEHTENCYIEVVNCVAAKSDQEAENPSEEELVQTPALLPSSAGDHVCTVESGCVTKVLSCQHQHDADCGYAEAAEETPCTHVHDAACGYVAEVVGVPCKYDGAVQNSGNGSYTVTSTNETGIIQAGSSVQVYFNNHRGDSLKYDLTYYANYDESTQLPVSNNYPEGAPLTLAGNNLFTRDGYELVGWNTEPDGHGDLYECGAAFVMPGTQVDLYAQWKEKEPEQKKYELTYESNGGTEYKTEVYEAGTTVELDKVPTRKGYKFKGWYAEEDFQTLIDEIYMDDDKTVYAKWKKKSDGGTNYPEVDPKPEPKPENPEEETSLAETPWLNTEDHYAYIVGYAEDGTVRPNANITRAEVATIFFRLLTDEARDQFWSTSNSFSDVIPDAWYNTAVSTMVNAGIIHGYEDGSFRPNNNITRAEFAAIASRFMASGYNVEEDLFTDIANHWARESINDAAMAKWINGYPDGTFQPNKAITRAEAVTLVNNVLQRRPDADHMLEDMIVWPDNPVNAWYYEALQEATNSHDYQRYEDEDFEEWIRLIANRDWVVLEQQWAQANDCRGSNLLQ